MVDAAGGKADGTIDEQGTLQHDHRGTGGETGAVPRHGFSFDG